MDPGEPQGEEEPLQGGWPVKKIKDLSPGDRFQCEMTGRSLTVSKVTPIPWAGIPRTQPMSKVEFTTEVGLKMTQNFRSERQVNLAKS